MGRVITIECVEHMDELLASYRRRGWRCVARWRKVMLHIALLVPV